MKVIDQNALLKKLTKEELKRSKKPWIRKVILQLRKKTFAKDYKINNDQLTFLRSICKIYGHVWNTVVMSGLVLLVATWNCLISYKNGYAGYHLLPLLNHWLIFKM